MSGNVEHERKFLVADPSVLEAASGDVMMQGYLLWQDDLHVRVRLMPEQDIYTLTIKQSGPAVTRKEVECPITADVAVELLKLCGSRLIHKRRYPIPGPAGIWTVDVFFDRNDGLMLAEIELSDPDDELEVPAWCGLEVTRDERYYNEYLVQHPFTTW